MWLTCDQAVLLRQLSRSPRKKKMPDCRLPERLQPGKYHFFSFIQYTSCILFDVTLDSHFSFRWTNMRLFPPFFPKSESKVLPRLAIEGRIVAFSLDTTSFPWSQWKHTYSFTTQYLLRDLLHNNLQVTKFSFLICRSVYIAWCSLPSSIVGWSWLVWGSNPLSNNLDL